MAGIERSQGTLESGKLLATSRNAGVKSAVVGAFWFVITTVAAVVSCGGVFVKLGIIGSDRYLTLGDHLMRFALIGLLLSVFLSLLSGIDTPVKHYVLRLIMKVWDRVPFNLTPLLKAGKDRTILRPAGGGFEFIHRTLRDHFADAAEALQKLQNRSARTPWLKKSVGLAFLALVLILPSIWHPLKMKIDRAERLKSSGIECLGTKQFPEAEAFFREALNKKIVLHGQSNSSVASLQWLLGIALGGQGKFEEADSYFVPTVASARREHSLGNRTLLDRLGSYTQNLANLAYKTKGAKRFAEAETAYRELFARMKEHYVFPCPVVTEPMIALINLLCDQAKWQEAEKVARDLVEFSGKIRKPPHAERILATRSLVACLVNQSKLEEAQTLIKQAIHEGHELASDDESILSDSYYWLTRIFDDLGLGKEEKEKALYQLAADLKRNIFEVEAQLSVQFEVTVETVLLGGQGSALGVQAGDVIISYNGKAIISATQLIDNIRSQTKSESIPIEIRRGTEILTLHAKPGPLRISLVNRLTGFIAFYGGTGPDCFGESPR